MEWKCKFCIFSCKDRSRIVSHYGNSHAIQGRTSKYPCVYADCVITFTKVKSMTAHIAKVHDKKSTVGGLRLRCCDCKREMPSVVALFSHHRKHTEKREMVQCPFTGCAFRTSVKKTYTAHVSKQHRGHGLDELKSDVRLQSVCDDNQHLEPAMDVDEVENSAVIDDDASGWVSTGPQLCASDVLEREMLRLFVKMHVLLHVPKYAIDEIFAGINHVHTLSAELVTQQIKQVFTDNKLDLNAVNSVADCVMSEHPVYKWTTSGSSGKGGIFSSSKLRTSAAQRSLPYVKPVEYTFGFNEIGKSCKFMYVPILQSIQQLLKRHDILEKVLRVYDSKSGVYRSFLDGSNFHKYANSDNFHLHLTLYTDEWECVNPLGTSRKIHKVTAYYWVFSNMDRRYTSTLHVMQLACLARYADVKNFSIEKFLKPLLEDLAFLEKTGVFIEALGDTIKGSVTALVADNLAAHGIGGFIESFGPNVIYPCRFCMVTSEDIQSDRKNAFEFVRRSVHDHNLQVSELHEKGLQSNYGVKSDCIFHKYLQSFHATTSLPPDISHDLLEGIVPSDVALCLSYFISQKYFDLKWLNNVISSYPYKFTDAVNRPQRIPEKFAQSGSVGGNATENWMLLRMLPFLIGSKIPPEDCVWDWLMDLKDIVELSFAPCLTDNARNYLRSKIVDRKRNFKLLFPQKKFKPKHHFVEHYPELIAEFGPLLFMWTMRFESKHSYLKRIVHESHNFKNILKTIAEKHQMMIAYYLSGDSFFGVDVLVPETVEMSLSMLSEKCQQTVLSLYPDATSVGMASYVKVNGTKYCSGLVVVVGRQWGLPLFAEIVNILVVSGTIQFLLRNAECHYFEHIRGYVLVRQDEFQLMQPDELYDFYPLIPYNYNGEYCVVLKHYIDEH